MWLCKKCRTRFALKYNPRKCPICGILNIAGMVERSDNPKDGKFSPIPSGNPHKSDHYTEKDLKREGINVKEMIAHANEIVRKEKAKEQPEQPTEWIDKKVAEFIPTADLTSVPYLKKTRGKYYNQIRRYRKAQKMGLKEVADYAGISITFLNKVERWMTRPRKETRKKIAEALKQKYLKIWPKERPHEPGTLLGEDRGQSEGGEEKREG